MHYSSSCSVDKLQVNPLLDIQVCTLYRPYRGANTAMHTATITLTAIIDFLKSSHYGPTFVKGGRKESGALYEPDGSTPLLLFDQEKLNQRS